MTIHVTSQKLHWNYFVALEHDLEAASRYVEFCERNFDVFSIELAHLLFAAGLTNSHPLENERLPK